MAQDWESFLSSQDAAMLKAYEAERRETVQFFKSLGERKSGKLASSLKNEELGSRLLDDLSGRLAREAKRYPKGDFVKIVPASDEAIGRVCIGLFIVNRAKEIRKITLERESLSLYALYSAFRNQVAGMLDESYFTRRAPDVLSDYLDIEPLLTACSELCGLAVPQLPEAISSYRKKLSS